MHKQNECEVVPAIEDNFYEMIDGSATMIENQTSSPDQYKVP